MPGNRVFISYKHTPDDEKLLKEFRVHLKPWEDEGLLNIWSDHEIQPSEDWHLEIQKIIESTSVAVLLLSANFLASDYIREHELIPLLRAREEGNITLACLYLRPSNVNDIPFEITLSSNETRRVYLTKYQGLNDPQNLISAKEGSEREALLAETASKLKNLVIQKRSEEGVVPKGRLELTVQFKLSGDQLTRSYFHRGRRITQYRSLWKLPPPNRILVRLYLKYCSDLKSEAMEYYEFSSLPNLPCPAHPLSCAGQNTDQ